MITLIKKGRTVKWLVALLAILMLATGCEKPCNENDPASDCYIQPPVVNPINAQLAAKRNEIHTFYRDSLLTTPYNDFFNSRLPQKPIMRDTTDIAPDAKDDAIEILGSNSSTVRKANTFVGLCEEYVKLENQAKK
jgi:hypothetical protein